MRAFAPSPGTPGEGGGEGAWINSRRHLVNPNHRHPNPLPEYRERGQERARDEHTGGMNGGRRWGVEKGSPRERGEGKKSWGLMVLRLASFPRIRISFR